MTAMWRVAVFMLGLRVLVSALVSRRAEGEPPRRLAQIGRVAIARGVFDDAGDLGEELEAWRVLCGRARAMTAEEIAGLRFCLLAGALVMAAGALLGEGEYVLPICVAAVVCSPGLASMLIRARVGKERRAAECEVGAAIGLLASWLGAGLTMEAGMRKLVLLGPPSLRMTFRAVVAAMDAGLPVHHALSRTARQSGLSSLEACAARIERNRDLGLPASELLHDTAATLRAGLHAAAKRRAGRRGPLATLVTALVIAPACVAFLATLLVAGMAGQGVVH
jgi:Flp pilus assembly protein TadB